MSGAPVLTIGIDFGTSNSAVAALDAAAGGARLVPLEGAATTLPTAVFFDAEDGRIHFGRAAVALYLTGHEGRLMRSLKSLLGSRLLQETTRVPDGFVSFQDVIARFLRELAARSAAVLGAMPQRVVIGRPVHFVDDDPARDRQAQASLHEAARGAGFEDIAFELEPIAAAFDHEQRALRESLTLVVDIGGGTSDFTVVRLGPQRRHRSERADDILGTAGVHIGGTDFDRKLNLAQVMPLLGFRHVGPSGREVPSAIFIDLATWHLINWQYSPPVLRQAAQYRTDYADPALHRRLMTTLEQRLGHLIAGAVEQAKIDCSVRGAPAAIELGAVEPGLRSHLEPAALARHLETLLAEVTHCALECVRRAGLAPAAVDTVYLTGGSSALPPFQALLRHAFPDAELVVGDLFGGVASGLACAGRQR